MFPIPEESYVIEIYCLEQKFVNNARVMAAVSYYYEV